MGEHNGRGSDQLSPDIAPLLAVPSGDRCLVESRAVEVLGFYARENGTKGPYQGHFAATLEYLPSDYIADPHLTLTVERRLTPFNMYSERFTTLWIRSLQDALIVYLSGTRASGSSDGTMVRGVVSCNGWKCKLRCLFPSFYRFRRICRLGARPANQWSGELEGETKRRRTAISAKLRALKQRVGRDFAARG